MLTWNYLEVILKHYFGYDIFARKLGQSFRRVVEARKKKCMAVSMVRAQWQAMKASFCTFSTRLKVEY